MLGLMQYPVLSRDAATLLRVIDAMPSPGTLQHINILLGDLFEPRDPHRRTRAELVRRVRQAIAFPLPVFAELCRAMSQPYPNDNPIERDAFTRLEAEFKIDSRLREIYAGVPSWVIERDLARDRINKMWVVVTCRFKVPRSEPNVVWAERAGRLSFTNLEWTTPRTGTFPSSWWDWTYVSANYPPRDFTHLLIVDDQ